MNSTFLNLLQRKINGKFFFTAAGCHCPLYSPSTQGYNVPSLKQSHFLFSHTKRKLRHALGVKKKDSDETKGLESVGRKSASSIHSGFMLCRGQNDVSVHESCVRNIIKASVRPSLQNIENTHVEDKENLSEVLNCRIDEQKNDEPRGDVEKCPPDISYACNGIPTGIV